MSNYTTNLNLLKKDPETEGNDYFNIQTMLNDNWDKIDTAVSAKETPVGAQTKVNNLAGAGRTSETVKGNADAIAAHTAETMQYSTFKLNKDVNDIFVEVQHKRADGTLIIKSILSGGTSPRYTTRTETKYQADGTTDEWTKTYALSYDANDSLVSEVLV